jgi:hypothetical protein
MDSSRIAGVYIDMSKDGGVKNCRMCLVIAREDGSLVMVNASADASVLSLEQLPTVRVPDLTAEQLEGIVATATGIG